MNTTRRERRWNNLSADDIRQFAREATTESAWNDALSDPMLVTSDRLAGKKLRFVFDEAVWDYEFLDERRLRWDYGTVRGEDIYNASPIPGAENVIFIHHYRAGQEFPAAADIIVDLDTGCATAIDAAVCDPDTPRLINRKFMFGQIEGAAVPEGTEKPHFTSDLVGKAIYWRHPDTNSTRGIKYIFSSNLYLTYVMHQQAAGKVWVATHPCDYVKIKDNVYLCSTIEDRQTGMQLVMVMNTECLRDCQSGFGIGYFNDEVDRLESWMHSGRVGEWTVMETYFD